MGPRGASLQAAREQQPWATGWSADRPLALDANVVFARDAGWEPGLRPYLRYRDLGLAQASGGFSMLAAFLAWYNAYAGIADSR